MKTYRAPWSATLGVTSLLATTLLVALMIGPLWIRMPKLLSLPWKLALGALLSGCALCVIRTYTITPSALLVRRLLWTTRIPLEGLRSANCEEHVMRGSLRICGNGGIFSFSGWFWNKRLGAYRALVTDGAKTVVLRFDKRKWVVSPDAPEEFVRELGGDA